MRDYHPDYTKYGMSKDRIRELRYMCRQYPEWKSMAASLIGVGAQQYSTDPHGTDVSDPVARLVEKREALLKKIAMVEKAAMAIDEGRWYSALIQNTCMGIKPECIDPVLFPTSNRNAFYRRRREFFMYLDLISTKSQI